jgi:hypothetical protein
MSTSRDLFGYAGSSHQPQGRVLTAEEAYGGYGALTSPTLTAEEEYGSDWYGEDDDDDDFGALDSPSLYAEEEYGEDDDEDDEFGVWYGAEHDDDDDDDFGYIDEFGAEAEADAEDMLAELEAELDEDIFGAWYGGAGGTLAIPPGTEGAMDNLGNAVDAPNVLLPEFLNPAGAEPGWIESGVRAMSEFVAPGDADEIAVYLMNEPGFGNWNNLSNPDGSPSAQQIAMVRNAVKRSAMPGLEQNWDEPFREAWANNPAKLPAAWQGLKATPSAIWAFLTTDTPNALAGWLMEVPGIGTAVRAWVGENRPDQMINGLAIRYWLLGLFFPVIYEWIAQRITADAQPAIQIVQQATAPAPAPAQDLGVLPIQPPPQVLPTPQTGLPSPQTILAIGYGLMTGGAVLGVFK